VLGHTAAQDGDYVLSVSDRYRQGGDRYRYRLTVRQEEPDFELELATDAIVATSAMPAELTVTVKRRAAPPGALGPITIAALDLPPGVSAAAVISEPSGPTADKVTLSFTTTGQAFSGPIRIRGRADQPRALERLALTPVRLGARFATLWLTAAP
jgi:hypothetical protein